MPFILLCWSFPKPLMENSYLIFINEGTEAETIHSFISKIFMEGLLSAIAVTTVYDTCPHRVHPSLGCVQSQLTSGRAEFAVQSPKPSGFPETCTILFPTLSTLPFSRQVKSTAFYPGAATVVCMAHVSSPWAK